MPERVDTQLLRNLVPPSALNPESFREVARRAVVERLAAGHTLFRAGDMDRKTVYLLSGEVDLIDARGLEHTVRAGTQAACHPLGNHQPRQHTARARTDITFTRLDTDLLDIYLTWDQLAGIEVSEIALDEREPSSDDASDWMTRILQSKAFSRVPPANIQQMFMRLEPVHVRAGDVVVRQGEAGDYYYIVSRGRCRVSRTSSAGQEVTLAELGQGDAFGEEALLSDECRNASVTMLTDGLLMRLSKADFDELLRAPTQKEVDFDQARDLVHRGAVLLDVRLESEYRNANIRGSVNLPMYMLRLKAETLDPARTYVVYCDTGRRSSAAAYLLSERGFDARVLKGGLVAMHKARLASQRSQD